MMTNAIKLNSIKARLSPLKCLKFICLVELQNGNETPLNGNVHLDIIVLLEKLLWNCDELL